MEKEIDRESGIENIELYVLELPEECTPEMCPFCMTNVNKDNLEDPAYYCFLKSELVSAQYGGIDVKDPAYFMCPLKPLVESEPYIDHEERIQALEEAIGILSNKLNMLLINDENGSINSEEGNSDL